MRRTILGCSLIVLLLAGLALAQSSGNFTYGTSGNSTNCILDTRTGGISGGALCSTNSNGGITVTCTTDQDCLNYYGSNSGATCNTQLGQCMLPQPNTDCGGNFMAGIHTSSGNGNVFVIRPSMVVGLLTDVTVSSRQLAPSGTVSSSALAGVDVSVSVGQVGGNGNLPTIPNFGVTYDARFIQISTNLFQAIAASCTNITNGCFLTFAESTVAAHSFEWIVQNLSAGNYGITVNWSATVAGQGQFESLTCVGPVNFTVTQNKVFHQNQINQY